MNLPSVIVELSENGIEIGDYSLQTFWHNYAGLFKGYKINIALFDNAPSAKEMGMFDKAMRRRKRDEPLCVIFPISLNQITKKDSAWTARVFFRQMQYDLQSGNQTQVVRFVISQLSQVLGVSEPDIEMLKAGAREFLDESPGLADSISEKPGLNFPKIAHEIVGLMNSLVEERSAKAEVIGRKRKRFSQKTGPLLTLGLFGAWGTGKSTLIHAIQSRLRVHSYFYVTINPWKWDGKGDPHRFMRDTFLAQAKEHKPKLASQWWWFRAIKALRPLFNHALLVLTLVIVLAGVSVYWNVDPQLTKILGLADAFFDQGTISQAIALIVAFGLSALIVMSWKKLQAMIDGFTATVSPSELGADGLGKFYEDIAGVFARRISDDSNAKPFVFFLDDLDRCSPERVSLFVESVHSLTAAGCIVVLACDEAYVQAALNVRYKDIRLEHPEGDVRREAFGRHFLEKIVQVAFYMPLVTHADLEEIGLTGWVAKELTKSTTGLGKRDSDDGSAEENTTDRPRAVPDAVAVGPAIGSLAGLLREPMKWGNHQESEMMDRLHDKLQRVEGATLENINAFVAYLIADELDRPWLSGWLKDEAPDEGLIGGNPEAKAILMQALGEIEKSEAAFGPVRPLTHSDLNEVIGTLLKDVVEPLGFNIRQVKSLRNTLKLYLSIIGQNDERTAQRAAAFFLAHRIDKPWLIHHCGGEAPAKPGNVSRCPGLDERLRDWLGAKEDLIRFWALAGEPLPVQVTPPEPARTDSSNEGDDHPS